MSDDNKTKRQKLLESIAKNQQKLKEIENKERIRFAMLAEKAGLLDFDYDENEMHEALKEVAARFRSAQEKKKQIKTA